MSAKYRLLKFGLILSVLFLASAANAAAASAKEQVQSTIDRVIEVLRTIRSPEDIERNKNALRQILLTCQWALNDDGWMGYKCIGEITGPARRSQLQNGGVEVKSSR